MTDTTTQTEATTQALSTTVQVTEPTKGLIDGMTGRLGFWSDPAEAALFLAGLALTQGKDPVPDDELEGDLVEIGQLSQAVGSSDQADQLTLLGLIQAPERPLDEVIAEDLTGLIEAGAGIARPKIAGVDVAEATGGLVELLQASG